MSHSSTTLSPSLHTMAIAPGLVVRGALAAQGALFRQLGHHGLVIGGAQTLGLVKPSLASLTNCDGLKFTTGSYLPDCAESSLVQLQQMVADSGCDWILGVGGGKALDTAKLVAHNAGLAIATVPTSAATCAGWTALSNVYSDAGAFRYDVSLSRCPDLLVVDYDLIATAPPRTLVAGIGDALAKWYEASVSSGHASDTLTVAAVQQARVLRDILLQRSTEALTHPGSDVWREVVDAALLMAGVVGGLGGANCRTVAAHAIHNGLTQLPAAHQALHGEKVAYGILVQLRLEELVTGHQLAATARQQLIQFYEQIGLPTSLTALGLANTTLSELQTAIAFACAPGSDIHRLPFKVTPEIVMAAMVSSLAEIERDIQTPADNTPQVIG